MTSTVRFKCSGCGQVFDGDAVRAFEKHVLACTKVTKPLCIECLQPLPDDAGPSAVRHAECCWTAKPKRKEWISVTALSWLSMGSVLLIGPSMVFTPKWVTISLFTILFCSIIGFIVKGIRREL